jgi:F-type H+-transporting ATPase subunit epsilon
MAHESTPAAGARTLRVSVVTPEQTVLEQSTDFVALPLYDGELGVAPGHGPMIGRLGHGELRIGHEPNAQWLYVDGGFVQVADDVVSVLTNRAVPAHALNEGSAAEALKSALAMKAAGDDLIARRERLIMQVRSQLRIARRPRLKPPHVTRP